MSLIEIVVVIAIITMLMSAVGMYAIGQLRESRVTTAAQQGFAPLLERRVLRDPPVDPWGSPFRYALVNGVPVISTLGADGVEGGADDAADLSTDQKSRRPTP
ncbi:MAG: hypothetical protein GQE15_37375 [Archangiaceae bacterium]|nr:hypothetical protein [Archangiaceae bacterium]